MRLNGAEAFSLFYIKKPKTIFIQTRLLFSMKMYLHDPYTTNFKAKIVDIVDNGIVLDNTYFYPEGGGQPADKGYIEGIKILNVKEIGEEIFHYLEKDNFYNGQSVECKIDEKFRLYCMKSHTATHIIFGVARKLLKDVKYSGFGIGNISTRIDFGTKQRIDDKILLEMEYLSNKVVLENRKISSYFSDEVEKRRLKDLAYAKKMPSGRIRIVEIEGWDFAACSGTHFKSTQEVGLIKIIERTKLQKEVTRIEFKIGEYALEEYINEKRILQDTTVLLKTSKKEITQKINKFFGDLRAKEKQIEELRENLIQRELEELQKSPTMIGGYKLYIGKISSRNPKELSFFSKSMVKKKDKSIVVLITDLNEKIMLAASCTDDIKIMLNEALRDILREFGGGGGGSPKFFQAGGILTSYNILKKKIVEIISKSL